MLLMRFSLLCVLSFLLQGVMIAADSATEKKRKFSVALSVVIPSSTVTFDTKEHDAEIKVQKRLVVYTYQRAVRNLSGLSLEALMDRKETLNKGLEDIEGLRDLDITIEGGWKALEECYARSFSIIDREIAKRDENHDENQEEDAAASQVDTK